MTKPVPAFIRKLATPYLDQLCPVIPPPVVCPVCPVPEPLPTVEKPIGIDSLFCPVITGRDTILADLMTWWSIGVRSISPSFAQDSGDISIFIGIAREIGFKLILPTPPINPSTWDEEKWVEDIKSILPGYLKYSPDAWYVSYEANISQDWGFTGYTKAIPVIRGIKDLPLYISPYYWNGPPTPTDDEVRKSWDTYVGRLTQVAGNNVVSAIQDGVGCDYNIGRRIIGSLPHNDFLSKAKIHKEVCESHGWKATVNCELFDTYPQSGNDKTPYPATADRIKLQIEAEGKSDYVSKGMGLGPCCSAEGISLRDYQMAWYPNHKEVAQMLLRKESL